MEFLICGYRMVCKTTMSTMLYNVSSNMCPTLNTTHTIRPTMHTGMYSLDPCLRDFQRDL